MTVSSSVGQQFTIDRIVRMAYRRAGLKNVQGSPSTAEASHAREELELIVDSLSNRGVYANAVTFEDVTCTAGVASYTLPATVVDVVGDGQVVAEGQDPDDADGGTRIRQIRREEWHHISGKSAQGRPTLFYTNRVNRLVSVTVWPKPDSAQVIRFQAHRRLADVQDGTATLDLEDFWLNYLVAALAAVLAESHSLPTPVVQDKRAAAEKLLLEARRQANQRPNIDVVVAHQSRRGR